MYDLQPKKLLLPLADSKRLRPRPSSSWWTSSSLLPIRLNIFTVVLSVAVILAVMLIYWFSQLYYLIKQEILLQKEFPMLPETSNRQCSYRVSGLSKCSSLNGRYLVSERLAMQVEERVSLTFNEWLNPWRHTSCRENLLEVFCSLTARQLGAGPCDDADDIAHTLPKDDWTLGVPAGRNISADPLGARIAYALLIQSHDTPEQIERLLSRIAHPRHYVAIHASGPLWFRSKVIGIAKEVARKTAEMWPPEKWGNWSYYILPTVKTSWGHWSLVQIELDAIDALVEMGQWDYLINLSGTHYPVEAPLLLARLMAESHSVVLPRNMLEIDFENLDLWIQDRQAYGVRYHCTDFGIHANEYYTLPFNRQLPQNVLEYKGSQWHILSRGFADYLSRRNSPRMHYWRRLFKYSWVPDESYFQTILLNSPFNVTYVNQASTFFTFPPDEWHPRVLDENDFITIVRSKYLFIRKVDPSRSKELMDLLDFRMDHGHEL